VGGWGVGGMGGGAGMVGGMVGAVVVGPWVAEGVVVG
jgi:hypothetical protein